MKINTYGYRLVNLRKVSGETVNNPLGYSQISYDTKTGELFENWHHGTSQTSWSQYRDPDVITVANTSKHMTMQQIADAVRDAMVQREMEGSYHG